MDIKEIRSLDFVEVTDEEFKLIRDLIYKNIGINLTEEKRSLVNGRLQKILRKLNFKTFKEYYQFLINDKSGEALSELANVISTNHTFFGREIDHFEYFVDIVLPEIEERAKKTNNFDIRVWSAGCSSGEEPYTLVMLMMEYFGKDYNKWKAGVLATDISLNALEKAKKGIYPDERVQPLPDIFKKKYFKHLPSGEWEIIDVIKREVTFRRFNLMNEKFPFKSPFDVIFCRNVMIYFDEPTRERLVDKFYQFTTPNGYLFIGHSETLNRSKTKYLYLKPAVYKKA
ncbi:MAG: protein-glutamate O-methyltransferase CheR [Ignavibacteria bacterium]|nr:protein-glutamate O-methyltransferase CheR [Ignavibacteria bacterium]